MYLLYLDDSGSPNNKNESHFVLGGCIVHEKSLFWVNKRLDDLAEKYKQTASDMIEFHASEIAGGRNYPWDKIPAKQNRLNILKEVLGVAAETKNNIKVLACAVDKNSYASSDPVELAFEDLCSRFQQFLHRKHTEDKNDDANGLIILDESAHETSLQSLAKGFRTLGNKWGITTHRIQEVPLFVDSKASRGIQLADHIAYSVFRRYEHNDLTYYNIIQGVFDSDSERMHGLCHKTFSSVCTCPYCVIKRYASK